MLGCELENVRVKEEGKLVLGSVGRWYYDLPRAGCALGVCWRFCGVFGGIKDEAHALYMLCNAGITAAF